MQQQQQSVDGEVEGERVAAGSGRDGAGSAEGGSVEFPAELARRLRDLNQEHIEAQWRELNRAEERARLLEAVEAVDVERAVRVFQASTHSSHNAPSAPLQVQPVRNVCALEGRSDASAQQWREQGLAAIAQGRLAVLLLAGGQGTRLGSSAPKGCYDIGLPSHKSLFQLMAERLLRMQTLAVEASGTSVASSAPVHIPWLIMTSPFTHQPILDFFALHNYFGLLPSQVHFFQQGSVPCFTMDGHIILETPTTLSQAPDGNGGVYNALKGSGLLDRMQAQGVTHVECFSVDNALIRVADPLFLGYVLHESADCAAKVVQKAYPEERVGVFVRTNHAPLKPTRASEQHSVTEEAKENEGKKEEGEGEGEGEGEEELVTAVMEYSELPPGMGTSVDNATGKLKYNWSNICIHMFSVEFLQAAAQALDQHCIHHLAVKRIPSVHGAVQGVKLEQFIFDGFPLASTLALLEVAREEFSPVKNAPGAAADSPDTARQHVLSLHARWVREAGGQIVRRGGVDGEGVEKGEGGEGGEGGEERDEGVEVSPLVSHSGEGLEGVCKGVVFEAPISSLPPLPDPGLPTSSPPRLPACMASQLHTGASASPHPAQLHSPPPSSPYPAPLRHPLRLPSPPRIPRRFVTDHAFEKPNDERGLRLMNAAATAVMAQVPDIVFAYGVSDEFSFVIRRDSNLYERRASKLISVVVSLFAASFVHQWPNHFPSQPLLAPPSFDARAVLYPSTAVLRDYLSWRQVDCHINNQYNTCFWMLVKSGLSPKEAQDTIKGTLADAKNELLFTRFGINYNDLPAIFRKGSSIFRRQVEEQVDGKQHPDGRPVVRKRSKLVVVHDDIIADAFWAANPHLLGE
ncbi:unnamed protein product [Closterium sp. Naga37s-1]|nr:unnamed protein product [Closterium sp. Naga37s-1]